MADYVFRRPYRRPSFRTALPRISQSDGPNIVEYTEQFDHSNWSAFDGCVVTANTHAPPSGMDPGGSRADTVEDTGASQASLFGTYHTIPNDSGFYLVSVFVLKDAVTSRFVEIGCQPNGGTTFSSAISVNTSTGSVVNSGTGGLVATIARGSVDHDSNYWRVWFIIQNNNSGNNIIRGFCYPARTSAHGGPEEAAVTGSTVLYGFNINRADDLQTYEPHPAHIAPLVLGAPTATFTAPIATLVADSGTTLIATAPVITVTAPTANRTTTVTQVAGAPTITITAPTANRVAAISLLQGAPTVTFSAPTANRTTTRTAVAGAPTVTFTAPATTIAFDQFLTAGAPVVTISAPTAVLSAGSGSQTLEANAAVITITAPTVVRVATVSRLAGAPTITLTAPGAGIEVTAGDQNLAAGAPVVTFTAPSATRVTVRNALAGSPTITITAPAPVLVVGGTIVQAGAPTITFTAPGVFIPLGGFAWPRTARYRYEYRV